MTKRSEKKIKIWRNKAKINNLIEILCNNEKKKRK